MENLKRYNRLTEYLKNKFGERTLKICIDGGFTCPNRDGTAGIGGCIFCSEHGSGDHLNSSKNIQAQIESYFSSYRSTRANKFIAYFQNFTNTYDTIANLKLKYDSALIDDRIVALAVATRPDCITEEVVKLLKSYSEKLSKRKQIIVANKIDSMQDENLYNDLEKLAKENNIEIFKISAVTGEGISELLKRVSQVLKELPKEELYDEVEDKKVYTLQEEQEGYTIKKEDGIFVVDGPAVDRVMRRVNLEDNESMYYFQKCLDSLGVNQKLKEAGVQEGDTVNICGWELEWYD